MRDPKLGLLFVAIALALLSCGQDPDETVDGSDPTGPIGVEQAVAQTPEGPVTVRGFVIEAAGEVRMCAVVLESYPPQCGDPSFHVEGLEVATMEGATTEGNVSWVDQAEVTGEFDGETLIVGR